MSEQLKKFTYKWNGNEWGWVDGGPFRALSFEVKMVRAEDADALAERLRECEKALEFYAHPINWDCQSDAETNNAIRDCDLSVPEGLCDPRGGKRAREYFKKWGNK